MEHCGLILLADGFEQTEALACHDILSRAGIKSDLVSVKYRHKVISSMKVVVTTKLNLTEFDISKYDFLVLPGGKLGVQNLSTTQKVRAIIEYFYEKQMLICAICAAPSILGDMGLLDNKKYTCFPGFQCGRGTYLPESEVVVDGKLITGRSMYWTIQFTETIVSYLGGEKLLAKIYPGTRGAKK